MHWDVEMEIGKDCYIWRPNERGQRFDWIESDGIYIPPNTIHQHFNSDRKKRARLLSATSSLYRHAGFDNLEQTEDAPRQPHE